MDSVREVDSKRTDFERCVQRYRSGANDYKWTWKAIEFELAFLYEVFFTSNEFLHFYQAKGASIWALASFIGICLVGVATAIPGTMASRHRVASTGPPNAGTVVVETTTADLIITLAILVSLALLQLVQLIRCWTSNWARVAFACKYSMHWQTLRNQFLVGLHDRFRAPTKTTTSFGRVCFWGGSFAVSCGRLLMSARGAPITPGRCWRSCGCRRCSNGDAQRHMRLLAEGGEFITHLWALLYHLGIDKWEMEHEQGPSSWRSVPWTECNVE